MPLFRGSLAATIAVAAATAGSENGGGGGRLGCGGGLARRHVRSLRRGTSRLDSRARAAPAPRPRIRGACGLGRRAPAKGTGGHGEYRERRASAESGARGHGERGAGQGAGCRARGRAGERTLVRARRARALPTRSAICAPGSSPAHKMSNLRRYFFPPDRTRSRPRPLRAPG